MLPGCDGLDVNCDVTYTCDLCGESTTCYSEIQCFYCKKKLCENCRVGDYCIDHYSKIPQNYLKKIKYAEKKKDFIHKFLICSNCITLIGIAVFCIFYEYDAEIVVIIWIFIIIFIIITGIADSIIFQKKKKKITQEIAQILSKNDN